MIETTIVETEFYEIELHFYHQVAWYAEQMNVSVDYFMDEYVIDGFLLYPQELTPYDYEETV